MTITAEKFHCQEGGKGRRRDHRGKVADNHGDDGRAPVPADKAGDWKDIRGVRSFGSKGVPPQQRKEKEERNLKKGGTRPQGGRVTSKRRSTAQIIGAVHW